MILVICPKIGGAPIVLISTVPAVVIKTFSSLGFSDEGYNERFIHPQGLPLMDRKRPHSVDGPPHTRQSPQKKQNTFKSPHQTPQKSTSVTQSKLPPGTPTVTTRYGISTTDASTLVDRIDTFAMLVKCVAHIVENCGGSYEEDRNLGSYLIDAVNAVTVCRPPSAPLRVLVLIIRERQPYPP